MFVYGEGALLSNLSGRHLTEDGKSFENMCRLTEHRILLSLRNYDPEKGFPPLSEERGIFLELRVIVFSDYCLMPFASCLFYSIAKSAFGLWYVIFSYWLGEISPLSFRLRSASTSVD